MGHFHWAVSLVSLGSIQRLPSSLFSAVHSRSVNTRWFKYDRDDLCVNKSLFVPVIFEPPCTFGGHYESNSSHTLRYIWINHLSSWDKKLSGKLKSSSFQGTANFVSVFTRFCHSAGSGAGHTKRYIQRALFSLCTYDSQAHSSFPIWKLKVYLYLCLS
jgi:hypothetical protein